MYRFCTFQAIDNCLKIHISFFEACFQILYVHACTCIYVNDMNKVVFKPCVPISLGIGALIDIGTLNQIPMHVSAYVSGDVEKRKIVNLLECAEFTFIFISGESLKGVAETNILRQIIGAVS